jgi:hypothetical protein
VRFLTSTTAQVRDLDGDLVLDLTKPLGYRHQSLTGTAGTRWRKNTTAGAYTDGSAAVTPATRAEVRRVERIKVYGDAALWGDPEAYWLQVEDRILALEAAVAQPHCWTIGLGGYLWTYRTINPADTNASEFDRDAWATGRRIVVVEYEAQPNPTKTAPGA